MVKTAAALALAIATGCASAAFGQAVVSTDHGAVSGATADGVESFKAIPFAAPPVGPLRWRPPEPPARWTGVKAAVTPPPACPQQLPASWGIPTPKWSEDCLYLNVWRPEGVKAGARLPVMVWIYGGGFAIGYSGSKIYDGSNLARRGVIVVNMNYRLGRLGWFAHPLLTAEARGGATADFGLMDQIAALKWVKANISAFGGDPSNVTVFGESAGAMSVNLLMISPQARGLFTKAITESGLGRFPAKPLKAAESEGQAYGDSQAAATLEAMRAIPVETLLQGAPTLERGGGAGPIIDGVVVPENVDAAFAAGTEAKVPWIVGSNTYEASLLPNYLANPDGVIDMAPAPMRPMMMKTFDPDNTGDKKTIAANILTDQVFTEPARYLASLHEKNGAPVWRYYFGYVPEAIRAGSPGAGHGSEIEFVFGTLGAFRAGAKDYTAQDRVTSDQMQRYWTDFAKRGTPDGAGLLAWPEDKSDQVLVIDDKGFRAETGHLKARLSLMAMSHMGGS